MTTKKLYVTRWVLARGILLINGRLERRKGGKGVNKDLYSLEGGDIDRHRRSWVCIGQDAFFTLEEAERAARETFEKAAQEAATRSRLLSQALDGVEQGRLAIHDLTSARAISKITELRAFSHAST